MGIRGVATRWSSPKYRSTDRGNSDPLTVGAVVAVGHAEPAGHDVQSVCAALVTVPLAHFVHWVRASAADVPSAALLGEL